MLTTRRQALGLLGSAIAALLTVVAVSGRAEPGRAEPQVWVAARDGASAVGTAADILTAAGRRGRLEVIVRLATPEAEEKADEKADEKAEEVEEARIAAAQDHVLATVPHARDVYRFSSAPFVSLLATRAELARLLANPNVAAISQNRLLRMTSSGAPSVRALKDINAIIGANKLHAQGIKGKGKVVILPDTGVAYGLAELKGSKQKEACFSTKVAGQAETFCPNNKSVDTGLGSGKPCPVAEFPECARGTELAKLVTASPASGKNVGVAPDAKLFVIQIFRKQLLSGDCSPDPAPCIRSNTADLAKALDWSLKQVKAADKGAAVPVAVSIGLSGGNFSTFCDTAGDPLASLFKKLKVKNITTVVGTGNNNLTNGIGYPACLSDALAVGNTTENDQPDPTANVWPGPMLFAPNGVPGFFESAFASAQFVAAAALTDADSHDFQEGSRCTGQEVVVGTTSKHPRLRAKDLRTRAKKKAGTLKRKYAKKADLNKVRVKRGIWSIKNQRLFGRGSANSAHILAEDKTCVAWKYDITSEFRHNDPDTFINFPGGIFVGNTTNKRSVNGNFFEVNKGAGGLGRIRQLRNFDLDTGAGITLTHCEGPAPHDPKKLNTLRIVGNGRKLTFYVNGKKVCSADNAYFISGAVGFLAGKPLAGGNTHSIEIESVTLKNAKIGPLPIEAAN